MRNDLPITFKPPPRPSPMRTTSSPRTSTIGKLLPGIAEPLLPDPARLECKDNSTCNFYQNKPPFCHGKYADRTKIEDYPPKSRWHFPPKDKAQGGAISRGSHASRGGEFLLTSFNSIRTSERKLSGGIETRSHHVHLMILRAAAFSAALLLAGRGGAASASARLELSADLTASTAVALPKYWQATGWCPPEPLRQMPDYVATESTWQVRSPNLHSPVSSLARVLVVRHLVAAEFIPQWQHRQIIWEPLT